MDEINVEMQEIEFAPAQMKLVQHGEMRRHIGFQRRRIEPDGLIAHRHQCRPCLRLRAREQRHVVPKLHQRVGQVRHDPFGAAVEPGRDRLIQRRDLSDSIKQSPREAGLARPTLFVSQARVAVAV